MNAPDATARLLMNAPARRTDRQELAELTAEMQRLGC